MRLYFEVVAMHGFRNPVMPGIYKSYEIEDNTETVPWGFWSLAGSCHKVWTEFSNGKVEWFKHREDPHQPVDLKEFLFVKLKAKPL